MTLVQAPTASTSRRHHRKNDGGGIQIHLRNEILYSDFGPSHVASTSSHWIQSWRFVLAVLGIVASHRRFSRCTNSAHVSAVLLPMRRGFVRVREVVIHAQQCVQTPTRRADLVFLHTDLGCTVVDKSSDLVGAMARSRHRDRSPSRAGSRTAVSSAVAPSTSFECVLWRAHLCASGCVSGGKSPSLVAMPFPLLPRVGLRPTKSSLQSLTLANFPMPPNGNALSVAPAPSSIL